METIIDNTLIFFENEYQKFGVKPTDEEKKLFLDYCNENDNYALRWITGNGRLFSIVCWKWSFENCKNFDKNQKMK